MKDHPGQIGCLVPYLCDKKQNGGQKSLLAEIVDFGINNLKPSVQTDLKDILTTAYTEDGQTLLDDYIKNSTELGGIKEKTLFYLQDFQDAGPYYSPEDTKSKLTKKIRFMNELRKKPDNAEYLALCLRDKKENDNQKSLLAEIVGFGIGNLRSSERNTLIKILKETYTIDGREQTLLDDYSENSTDSEKIKAETLFYLQEFQDVTQYYNSEYTKSKLARKIWFMEETMKKHLDQTRCLVPYLCDIEKNGGQQSLLAEIVDVGINNLESSDQDTLKKILNTVCTENGQTLLDYYSEKSTDSNEIKAKTLTYLRESTTIGEKLNGKLSTLERFAPKSSDDKQYLLSYLCDKKENDNQKSLLAEIVGSGIDKLKSRNQVYLKNLLSNTRYTEDGKTLLYYYSKKSTDSEKTRIETSFYLREFRDVYQYYSPAETEDKLTDKICFMRKTMKEHPGQIGCLVPYLCDIEKNGGQKSLLAEIATFGIDNLESSDQDTLKKILNEKYTIGGCEQTLLDYYRENSKDSREIKEKTLKKLKNFLGVGPGEQSLTRKAVLPGLETVFEVNGSDSLRRPKACGNPGLETVFEVNGSDGTVKTPKDINKAPQESDTQTINKGNGGRSFD